MVDFLFIILAVFAVLAVTRTSIYDNEINLVKIDETDKTNNQKLQPNCIINISIDEEGRYKWFTDINEFFINDTKSIQEELIKQQELGLLTKDKEDTKIFLHIDKNAQWEPIAQAIFAIKSIGFHVTPVYTPNDRK